MATQFKSSKAVRSHVPLLFGIVGPTGSGKSFSALRVASGIQKQRGGKIVAGDTESKRLLHYADYFDFEHTELAPPFGSLRYLEFLRWSVNDLKASVVIIDSASHEHEGEGGYLQLHEQQLDRLSKGDASKRNAVNFLAWAKPSAERRELINGLLQLNACFIFCFRAKEKLKIERGKDPVDLGWMAIAGAELLYEMTAVAMLEPAAAGVPTWRSQMPGTSAQIKLPIQFKEIFKPGEALCEAHGEKMALWASGKAATEVKPVATELAPAPAKPSPQGKAHDESEFVERIPNPPEVFRFTKTLRGANTSTPDGDLWARSLVDFITRKPADAAREFWDENKANVRLAISGGQAHLASLVVLAAKARFGEAESEAETENAE
jgi:energy-coupling factor transporter ATP-binding protein EcfA2